MTWLAALLIGIVATYLSVAAAMTALDWVIAWREGARQRRGPGQAS